MKPSPPSDTMTSARSGLDTGIEPAQLSESRLCSFGFGGDDSDPRWRIAHPPVTLI
jgi:hypothetical protein